MQHIVMNAMCVVQVSIIPRTNQMLGFAQYMPEDRKLHSQDAVSAHYNCYQLNFYLWLSFLKCKQIFYISYYLASVQLRKCFCF